MLIAAMHLHLCSEGVRLRHSWSRRTSVLLNGPQMCIKPACNCTRRHSLLSKRLHMPLQAVSKAEAGVTEAEKRLMQLQKDKEELDRQLQQTQKAVLAGKQKVEKLREEIQRRTEARTVSTAPVKSCAYDSNTAPAINAVQMDASLL